MAGYFEDVLISYRPAAPPAGAESPWLDPFPDAPDFELPLPDAPPANSAGAEPSPPVPQPPDATPPPDRPQPLPGLVDTVDPTLRPEPPTSAVRLVEHETQVIERAAETPAPTAPDADTPKPTPALDRPVDDPVERIETHLHEHVRIVDERPPPAPPDAEVPAPRVSPPETAAPELPGTEPNAQMASMAADFARVLARLENADPAPTPFVSPEDFEPDTGDAPLPPDVETVREITREVVTEIHHHHHEPAPPPRPEPSAAPVPRTAAEASQIGPIRFASAWKTEIR